jgi:hypothetical protein
MSAKRQSESVPAWLSDLQVRFGAVLRTPLDRSSGTLRPVPAHYDGKLMEDVSGGPSLSAGEQLGVYNRQYWCRLFGVLQTEYRLTARLLGFWRFNDYAARFLLEHPPRGYDIHRVADGFDEFLGIALPKHLHRGGGSALPRGALLEAATVDLAFRRLLYAPDEPVYRPTGEDVARLGAGRLLPSSRWMVLEEHWPLVELQRQLVDDSGEDAVLLPPKLPAPRSWLLYNTMEGATMVSIVPARAAKLFRLLARHSVGEALARLEATCPFKARAELPEKVQRWLAQSVELGFWIGFDDSTQQDYDDKEANNA